MPRLPNTSPQTLSLFQSLLAARTQWRHGYDLAKETGLKSGTLYPLLMRLADQQLLESCWQTDGNSHRPRHVYRLTLKGVGCAKEQLSNGDAPLRKSKLRRSTV